MVTYSEEWRDLVGYESEYSISNFGRVKRKKAGRPPFGERICTPQYDSDGYIFVYLTQGQKQKCLIVHIAVAQAFIGPCPLGYEVDHVDGNPGNPKVDNLEYVTKAVNMQRARLRNGTLISDETRKMVIDLRGEGFTYRELALVANIGVTTAWKIVHGTDRVAGEV